MSTRTAMSLGETSGTDDAAQADPGILDRDAPFYVAGHRGLIGSAIWRRLERAGFTHLIGVPSSELDLLDRTAVEDFFAEHQPRHVALAAAKVGGIQANNDFPVDFLSENLRIQGNVMDSSVRHRVHKLLFLGSSCIYPRFAPQPIPEDALLTGKLEVTNDAYAVAKIAGIQYVKAVRRQYGLPWISAMPSNLYGPGDNFRPGVSHVLPAFIMRYRQARDDGAATVTNWGTGTPLREFLYADDCADACLFLLDNYDGGRHLNVGTGAEISIKDLAALIADVVGYEGETVWDATKPDGTPRKMMDVSRLTGLGWRARTGLRDGVVGTVRWLDAHEEEARTA